MLVLDEYASFELTIKNSRFLAEAFAVSSAEEAREKLREQKEKYADASHVVHAFVVGPSGGVQGCSDDGEPSGTSGRPTLEVLKGTGVTNVMITVTRWFGGTKLGTGGLVKAYTESAQGVAALMVTSELVEKTSFEVAIPYALYDQVKILFDSVGVELSDETFGEEVCLRGQVRESEAAGLEASLRDISRGKVGLIVCDEEES